MAPSRWRAATRIHWSVHSINLAGRHVDAGRLDVKLHFRAQLRGQQSVPEWCWFDSGAPLSVIPFSLHHNRLMWQPLPGVQTTWAGQLCDLGTIDVWFPGKRKGRPIGPFSMLAKFVRTDPAGGPVPILLGLEFLLAHQAHLTLNPPPSGGALRVP
jgi:hypothetical protein